MTNPVRVILEKKSTPDNGENSLFPWQGIVEGGSVRQSRRDFFRGIRRDKAISVKECTSLLVFSLVFRVAPVVTQRCYAPTVAEDERKSFAIWYILFRQSPKYFRGAVKDAELSKAQIQEPVFLGRPVFLPNILNWRNAENCL